jgi:uncharacterized protein (TIGR00255 family)
MTGQGQGRRPFDQTAITVEVRAVNNRFLKLQTRVSQVLIGLEPQIENLVRQSLRRGSLQLGVSISGQIPDGDYSIQESVLQGYYHQCSALAKRLNCDGQIKLSSLLALPGVVVERTTRSDEIEENLTTAVLATVSDAMDCLNRMRQSEGASMAAELGAQLMKLRGLTDAIEARAPQVVEDYKTRLHQRLSSAMANVGAQIQETELIREVLLMADKADIREEIVRLRSHFQQFQSLLEDQSSQGRKLDFLTQELFREANTIGAKANDAEIAQRVIDLKSIIEQMRELVQNVE